MGRIKEPVEGRHIAKHGMDRFVIRYVVAKIRHGRGEDGRYPDGVNAQVHQVIEPVYDALEVANAIAIAVHKTAWVYLVEYTVLPPNEFVIHCSPVI